ncbi:hypothetical protein MMC13_003846 [Lambiella insularis]|nr:hypothetical protein [Lambiella insularis]
MAIIFESFEAVHQKQESLTDQTPQQVPETKFYKHSSPKQQNLLSCQVGKGDPPTPHQKARKNDQIAGLRAVHAMVRNKERARGLEVGYTTNTQTDEYRVFTYSPAVRDKVAKGEISAEILKPGIRDPVSSKLAAGEASGATRKTITGQKRSYGESMSGSGEVAIRRKGMLTPEPERRALGRPRKRPHIAPPSTEPSSSTTTSSQGLFNRPDLVPGSRMEEAYARQPELLRLVAHAHSCQEKCPHPTTGEEEITSHSGIIQQCSNHQSHAQRHLVCEQCITTGHQLILAHKPHLLDSAFLPVCEDCTAMVKAAHPSPKGHNGCRCPTSAYTLPKEKPTKFVEWMCLKCRVRELEKVSTSKQWDEEARRGIVGAGIVNGKVETVMLGTVCMCGKQLGGVTGSGEGVAGCAKRCAACGGFWCAGAVDTSNPVGSKGA